MFNNQKVTAIILAAGNSTRFGSDKNKVLVEIFNKPIFLYSLEVFSKNSYIDDIIIVAKKDEENIINGFLNKIELKRDIKIVLGGNTRKQSVQNALLSTSSDIVIIHDSARPAIKDEYINKCIEIMKEYKGVSIGVKSKDTIKITDDYGTIKETTERKNTWIVQTPQCFEKELLLSAHKQFENDESITDDCMLIEKLGYDVKMLEGDYSNIKVTTQEDADIIKCFLK